METIVKLKVSFYFSNWIVRNPKVKFFIETINDFEKATSHNLELFELPSENKILLEKNDLLMEMMLDFDYYFRKKSQIISEEFRKENKGKIINKKN